MSFSIVKNGYSPSEVDAYLETQFLSLQKTISDSQEMINKLRIELDSVKGNEKNISLALTAAIDKAKEIETSSKQIYALKIEQLSILYSKWETLLAEISEKYPDLEGEYNAKKQIDNLKSDITNVLENDFNIDLILQKKDDPVRELLAKITGRANERANEKPSKTLKITRTRKTNSNKTELDKLEEKSRIKPIANVKLEDNESFDNPVDKFLSEEAVGPQNAFEKKLTNRVKKVDLDFAPNETGFDLKKAVNPNEDLDEIMKAFDFYPNSAE